MSGEDADRVQRYAEAIHGEWWSGASDYSERAIAAVMAVADAEQEALAGALNYERDVACTSIQRERVAQVTELRAEAERMKTAILRLASRATQAEAKLARIEALWADLDSEEILMDAREGRVLDSARRALRLALDSKS